MKFYGKLIITILYVLCLFSTVYADNKEFFSEQTIMPKNHEEETTTETIINNDENNKNIDNNENIENNEDNKESKEKVILEFPEINNYLIPENAIKVTKNTIMTNIIDKFYWSSISYIDHGNFYCLRFFPNVTLDNQSIIINYNKNLFEPELLSKSIEYINNILYTNFLNNLINEVFVEDSYYFVINSDKTINIYTEYLTGQKQLNIVLFK